MRVRAGPAALLSQDDLDSARLDLLRQRVTTFGLTVGALILLLAGVQLLVMLRVLHLPADRHNLLKVAGGVLTGFALMLAPRLQRWRFRKRSLRSFVWRTIFIVIMSVVGQTPGAAYIAKGVTEALRPLGFTGNIGPMFPLIFFMLCVHTAGALIVPWTVLEACVPPIVLTLVTLGMYLLLPSSTSASFAATGIALCLLSGVPGVSIAFLRRDTLGLRLLGSRYAEVERELSTARRIHDRLFPLPITSGPLRMSYRYEPMRQIGGDYLDLTRHADGSLTIALIDVTGHGVAAALAVNRLHGELKRALAQNPDAEPAALIAALNEYIHLTLADEQVFATAVALRARPDGAVSLCIAGHPPPLLRRLDGTVTALDSTAAMLGMLGPQDFDAESAAVALAPGELLVLYTDGATEAQDRGGKQLGIAGVRQLVAGLAIPEPDHAVARILEAVTAFRAGAAQDDTLIVALGT